MKAIKVANLKQIFWLSLFTISVFSLIATASLLELLYKTAEPLTMLALGIGLMLSFITFVISLVKSLS
jgi:hypothetical protein